MTKFSERSVFADGTKRAEDIRLYAKDSKTTGQIAIVFNCSRDEVERMLKSQGELL